MKKSRDNLIFWGVLILSVGVFGRCFDSVTLNGEATKIAAKYTSKPMTSTFMSWQPQAVTTNLPVPTWLGWSCLCIGGVLIIESLFAPKEG